MARALVDTNVLVYSVDLHEPKKRAVSIDLVGRLAADGDLVLSAQCLNEFSAAALRRGMSISEVIAAVEQWQSAADLLPLVSAATTAALNAVSRHRISFWDALIWATARDAGISIVFSEDFQHGRTLEGVQFLNPFLA